MSLPNITSLGKETGNVEKLTDFRKKLRWHIQSPPDDLAVKMMITPSMAAIMLEHNQDDDWANRPESQSAIKKYASEMDRGNWVFTGETIIFSAEGYLLNGQNRLMACAQSGRSFETLVVFGIAKDAFAFMDRGKVRTASDIFAIHKVPSFTSIASAARWVANYEQGGMYRRNGILVFSPDDLYNLYLGYDGLQKSVWVGQSFASSRLAPPSLMLALHYLCARKNRTEADEFFQRLSDGVGFTSKTGVVYKLRQHFLELSKAPMELGGVDRARLIIQNWNILRTGKKTYEPKINPSAVFPKAI